uniref:Uncharacterized protein n=1 Tax=Cacopsylla melanoneura TaxID=428564 RepID=A0A8D8VHA4_9HEMI
MKECFSNFEEMRRDSRFHFVFYFKTLHLIYLRLSIFSRLVRFVPPIKTTWSVKNRTFKRFPSISIVDFFFFLKKEKFIPGMAGCLLFYVSSFFDFSDEGH